MREHDIAVRLRDAAFDVLTRSGKVRSEDGGLRCVSASTATLRLVFRTPFQKMPGPRESTTDSEALLRSIYKEPSHGIDVWAGNKVFSVVWGPGDPLTVISFERGLWEAELVTAAEAAGPTS